jgi:hypothetical protein
MRNVDDNLEKIEQMISESENSETQRIEFKSDSFSATMSNQSKHFLRAHELEIESVNETLETIPDELVGVKRKSHDSVKLDVLNSISIMTN